jgi:multimeric flavodoxin WrbA
MSQSLKAVVLNCTLKPSPAESSTDKLSDELLAELAALDVSGSVVRIIDHNVKFGVDFDMENGDGWPAIRKQVLDADILIVATPIWMGHMASVAQMVLERLDAELGETDDDGHFATYNKVAGVVVVGNEDGAHDASAGIFQGLNDVGYTIPANAVTYWNGEAMGSVDYKDLNETPENTASATHMVAVNTAHLARALQAQPYPPLS